MKKLSAPLLAHIVESRRKAMKLTQLQLSQMTGIHRALLSRLESERYTPSRTSMPRALLTKLAVSF